MAQEGFLYEEKAYDALHKYGITTGGTAGASHDKPDLTIQNKKKIKTGCELKNSPTAAGSLVMKYHKGKWGFSSDTKGDAEKEFMLALATKANLLKEMNTSGPAGVKWRGKTPALQNDAQGKKMLVGFTDKKKAYDHDLKLFGSTNEVHIDVGGKAVSDYYNSKKCHYINVGTHGFFLLNSSDPLGLNKNLKKTGQNTIPDFSTSANCKIRVRCQYKGGGDYQFVMTLQFYGVKKSPYNIAPLKAGSKSEIDIAKLSKDPIILAF
jgi:hypothetical protein